MTKKTEEKVHAIFWRMKQLFSELRGNYDIVEYRVLKATNKNTLRRIRGEGWFAEGPLNEIVLQTKTTCQRAVSRMNSRQAQEVDSLIEKLKEEREKIGTAPPSSSSLLLKPMGRGH